MVREIKFEELNELLKLYLYLHEKNIPEDNDYLKNTWNEIMNDKNHHIIVNEVDNKIVSSCVLIIIPNLPQNKIYLLVIIYIKHFLGIASGLCKHLPKLVDYCDYCNDGDYTHCSSHSGRKCECCICFFTKADDKSLY